jgi:inorganic pyrophosphatase
MTKRDKPSDGVHDGLTSRWQTLGILFRSHPWHGVPIGPQAPEVVTVYVEIVPTDTVKYELDKVTGILRVDRPQKYSNVSPSLYGLIPRTLCADRVAELCSQRTGRPGIVGDGDPLDVCVLTERVLAHGDVLVRARPIGGLRMLDGDEADDKIVAVLDGDGVFGAIREVEEVPPALLDRLRHYFLTYKQSPDTTGPTTEITHVYGREEALEVIRRSQQDYHASYGDLDALLDAALPG